MDEKILDKLNDSELLYILSMRYGVHIPKWRECSKKEYDKYDKLDLINKLFNSENYKKVPVYKKFKPGILWQIENLNRVPDYYKYYKMVGEEFTLMIGTQIMEYLNKRRPSWLDSFKK